MVAVATLFVANIVLLTTTKLHHDDKTKTTASSITMKLVTTRIKPTINRNHNHKHDDK